MLPQEQIGFNFIETGAFTVPWLPPFGEGHVKITVADNWTDLVVTIICLLF